MTDPNVILAFKTVCFEGSRHIEGKMQHWYTQMFSSIVILVTVKLASGCRHKFFEDVDELRAQERERNNAKRMEILERRQRQIEEVIEKKKGASSTWTATGHILDYPSGEENHAAVQPGSPL